MKTAIPFPKTMSRPELMGGDHDTYGMYSQSMELIEKFVKQCKGKYTAKTYQDFKLNLMSYDKVLPLDCPLYLHQETKNPRIFTQDSQIRQNPKPIKCNSRLVSLTPAIVYDAERKTVLAKTTETVLVPLEDLVESYKTLFGKIPNFCNDITGDTLETMRCEIMDRIINHTELKNLVNR